MGMFDSFTGADGSDWQTKAMDCYLDRYGIGDEIGSGDFQMLVIGDPIDPDGDCIWAYVTVRQGCVAEVGVPRDRSLPCIDYQGGPLIDPKGASHE